jgi:hypothetical protein
MAALSAAILFLGFDFGDSYIMKCCGALHFISLNTKPHKQILELKI